MQADLLELKCLHSFRTHWGFCSGTAGTAVVVQLGGLVMVYVYHYVCIIMYVLLCIYICIYMYVLLCMYYYVCIFIGCFSYAVLLRANRFIDL